MRQTATNPIRRTTPEITPEDVMKNDQTMGSFPVENSLSTGTDGLHNGRIVWQATINPPRRATPEATATRPEDVMKNGQIRGGPPC